MLPFTTGSFLEVQFLRFADRSAVIHDGAHGAQSSQPSQDGAVIRWRSRLQTADIRYQGIGLISWVTLVQRDRSLPVLVQFRNLSGNETRKLTFDRVSIHQMLPAIQRTIKAEYHRLLPTAPAIGRVLLASLPSNYIVFFIELVILQHTER